MTQEPFLTKVDYYESDREEPAAVVNIDRSVVNVVTNKKDKQNRHQYNSFHKLKTEYLSPQDYKQEQLSDLEIYKRDTNENKKKSPSEYNCLKDTPIYNRSEKQNTKLFEESSNENYSYNQCDHNYGMASDVASTESFIPTKLFHSLSYNDSPYSKNDQAILSTDSTFKRSSNKKRMKSNEEPIKLSGASSYRDSSLCWKRFKQSTKKPIKLPYDSSERCRRRHRRRLSCILDYS